MSMLAMTAEQRAEVKTAQRQGWNARPLEALSGGVITGGRDAPRGRGADAGLQPGAGDAGDRCESPVSGLRSAHA